MRASLFLILLSMVAMAEEKSPFSPPEGFDRFVRQHTSNGVSTRQKLQMLVDAIFRPVESDGLGLVYDNEKTRTLEEVLTERKANCLSLTALYVASCKLMKVDVHFATTKSMGLWRKTGEVVRYERHMVAVVPMLPENIVADFLPRVRSGPTYVLPVTEQRALALFHSNRAVEWMDANQWDQALAVSAQAIQVDPSSSTAWNTRGVIFKGMERLGEAERCYRKAIAVDPLDGLGYGNLENLLVGMGRDAEARIFREKSLRLRAMDPFFNAHLAEEAYQTSQFPEAMDRIKRALKQIPREPEFHLIKAKIALAQGDRKDASKALESASKWALNPKERERFESKLARLKQE